METLVCAACGVVWQRPRKTGPKPSRCPDCSPPPGHKSKPLGRVYVCEVCGRTASRTGKRGPMPTACDPCARERARSARNAYQRKQYAERPAFRQRRQDEHRRWRETNPDYERQRHLRDPDRPRRWRERNPDWWPQYYANNRSSIIQHTNQYRRAHPTASRRTNARRNQRQRHEGAEFIDPLQVFTEDNWTCGLCGDFVDPQCRWPDPECAELDHIIPVARDGKHVRNNVQCAHRRCNQTKGARAPE